MHTFFKKSCKFVIIFERHEKRVNRIISSKFIQDEDYKKGLIEFINLFHDKEKNTRNGKLIYSTHDTTNLNKETFRRDEIWFSEKDKYGVSELFSLLDYKIDENKVRNDATYNKDYLTGRYGAIPVFQEFNMSINERKK